MLLLTKESFRENGTNLVNQRMCQKIIVKQSSHFMKKNTQVTKQLLKKYNIRERDFKRSIDRYRGNINTITEFRSLWMDSTNPYAKVYRILAAHYMRKYSLSRIFNSRI